MVAPIGVNVERMSHGMLDTAVRTPWLQKGIQHICGVGIRGPRGRVDHPAVEFGGVQVVRPEVCSFAGKGLPVQRRLQVAVQPCQ